MPTTSLQVRFSESAAGALGLTLVLDDTFGSFGIGKRRLRLYPGVNAKVVTSAGTVTKNGIHALLIERDTLQFNGSDSASAARPVIQLLNVDKDGLIFDDQGNPTSANFYNDNGQIIASKPVYGAIVIEYLTTYLQIDYEAEVTLITGNIGGGVQANLGSVIAFFDAQVASLQLEPADFPPDEGKQIFQVVSEAVAQSEGLFEKPKNWTGEPGSPTFPGGTPDPTEASQLHERIHEIGYITERNSVFTRTQFVAAQQPFFRIEGPLRIKIATATESGQGPTQDQLDSAQAQAAIATAKEKYKIPD